MRILCCNPNGGACYYITKGFEDAFTSLGHQFLRWDGTDDALRHFKPDLYLGCSGWRQQIPAWARTQFGTKIAIHVNPHGSTRLIRQKGEPDINETQGAIDWTVAQKPDVVYCYANDLDIQHMFNLWEETYGITVTPMPTAGNSVIYKPVPKESKFTCDVGFIGGYWPYKAINISKYVTPVINKYSAKVYGWGGWKHPKYCGSIADADVNKLFSSAKVCPSVVEPHTSRYGIDIPERMWKIPLGGGFTILDPCFDIENYIDPKIFPVATDPKNYLELVGYYLAHEKEREELRVLQRKYVLNHHTYYHRLSRLLNDLDFIDECDQFDSKIAEIAQN